MEQAHSKRDGKAATEGRLGRLAPGVIDLTLWVEGCLLVDAMHVSNCCRNLKDSASVAALLTLFNAKCRSKDREGWN